MLPLSLLLLLLPTAYAYFPAGSCAAQSCSMSPYMFEWKTIDNNNGLFCFDVVPQPCFGPCCSIFQDRFMKWVIKTNPSCKSAFGQVNINGLKKPGGVFYDMYNNNNESELRVTSMTYTNTTITGNTFCIIMKSPCQNLNTFCNGKCLFSVYEPYQHKCCPTCNFLNEYKSETPPSPSSVPPPVPWPPYSPLYDYGLPPPPPVATQSPSPPPPIVRSPPPVATQSPSPPPPVSPSPPPPVVRSPPPPVATQSPSPPPPTVNISPPLPPMNNDMTCDCTCKCKV